MAQDSHRGVHPAAHGNHHDHECGPTQNHKFTYNLFFAHQFSLVFAYLMCDPRQLFLQVGPEAPKVCTPQQRDCLPPCLALHLTVECILHPDRVWEPLATGTWASSQQSLSLLVDQVPHSSLWDKELAGDVHCYDMAGVAW